jgi:predicted RNA-binding Zn-ribbon protein involved in translation (DUF1610 family)
MRDQYFCYACGSTILDMKYQSTFTCPECMENGQVGDPACMSSYDYELPEFINPIFLENSVGSFWWEECLLDYEEGTSNVYLIRLPKNYGIIPRFYYKWLGNNMLMLNDIVTEESFSFKIPNE